MAERRVLHCWKSGPHHYEPQEDPNIDMGAGSMCMLLLNHEGPHDFTRNDEIEIVFIPQ